MATIITFQESNYTDSGYLYRCPGDHYNDFSGEYVPLAEYEALQAERDGLRAAHQELSRLARDVSRNYSSTSWSIGAIRQLTQYIDDKDKDNESLRTD